MKKLIPIIFITLVLGLGLGIGSHSPLPTQDPFGFNILYAGTPDSFGNQILNCSVYQDSGSYWEYRGSINESVYTGSDTITGFYNQSTLFVVWTRLNYTFVTDSVAARLGSTVFIRIGTVVSFTEMTADDVELFTEAEGWLVRHTYEWDVEAYPEIATYTVTIRYSSVGSIDHLLGNANDLTETDGTFDRGIDGFLTTGGVAVEGRNRFYYEAGYWYTQIDDTGYITDTNFRPLDGVNNFTIELWFSLLEGSGSGSGLPSQDGNVFYLLGQYTGYSARVNLYVGTDDEVGGRIGNGTAGSNLDSNTVLEVYHLYHLVVTWKTGNKPVMYLNNSASLGSANVTGNIDADADLIFGVRNGGSDYGNMAFLDCTIWNRELTAEEVTLEYNAGPEIGFVTADNVNNSWSFNEYSSGLYAKTESTVHDGLASFGLREAWSLYAEFTTISLLLAPDPFTYPEVYIWLGGWVLMPLGIALGKWKGKQHEEDKLYFWFLGFLILMFGAVIVIGGV